MRDYFKIEESEGLEKIRVAMNTEQMRIEIKQYADSLSVQNLEIVHKVLLELANRESLAATEELLAVPGFLEDLQESEGDLAKGNLTNWRQIRTDV
ncbi:MAG: hypothetical protein HC890_03355 [Chloroflexaceae bacterium]|nr:hypothetical protein [Chloroflexaceae bacterium]